MASEITLNINGQAHQVTVDPNTPLLYVLRNDLGLKGPKFGCGLEQCSACKVLIDGADVPSCQLPVSHVQGAAVTTLEGLGTEDNLHPLQEAFLEEQAAQCAFCTAGMIVAAQGLLNRTRYPSDEEIRTALDNNLCRCGVYDRVRRAIKLRIGRPEDPIFELRNAAPLDQAVMSSELPASLRHTPQIDSWIRVNVDDGDDAGTITIFSGKAELGQGIKTALAQIAAEELDVALSRIRVTTADTSQTPDEGSTTGSMSIETSAALRLAASEARHFMLTLAFEQLEAETPAALLTVADGTITDPATGRQTTYWDLMAGKRFGQPTTGFGQPKPPDQHRIVGQSEKRIDLPGKLTGAVSYVHDRDLPDMLHGRVVRPPGYHARLESINEDAVRQMPGVVALVRDGSFLAVIASHEVQAVNAAEALRKSAVWGYEKTLLPQEQLYDDLLTKPAHAHLIVNGAAVDDPIPAVEAPPDAAQTLSAAYQRPYHMHAALGPSAALAQWADGQLTVWSHTQGAFSLQAAIAHVLNIETSQIRVIHVEGSGCYGHNGADDAGLDAALLARAVPGKPVMVKWKREDEHGWEPYGSAMAMQLQASLNADGTIIDWNHDVWSYSHSTRPNGSPEGSTLLAAWHLAQPVPPPPERVVRAPHFGDYRNAAPKYAFQRQRVVRHLVSDSPLRTSALRSLGAYANVFAIESFMDELALAAGVDPIVFRLRHLSDERAKAVLTAAAEKANWPSPRPRPANDGHGWGAAFVQYKNRQCYAAVIVELDVDREGGAIHLNRVTIAADSGQVVNPDGLSNQLEGGFVQGASWTLHEQVTYDSHGVTSLDWDTYPILRFSEAPIIQTVILNRPELPFLGSGEVTQNTAPAAIANAVFDAVGVRLRRIPFTPAYVKSVLESHPE